MVGHARRQNAGGRCFPLQIELSNAAGKEGMDGSVKSTDAAEEGADPQPGGNV